MFTISCLKMKKIAFFSFVLVSALLWPSALMSQETHAISLEEAVSIALDQNWQVRKSLQELQQVKADRSSSLAAFLPTVEVSSMYAVTNDPLYAFGYKLQQGVVTQADFNPELLNDPGTTKNFNAGIEVVQPLFNIDAWQGRGATGSAIRAVENKAAFTRQHIVFLVKRSYYALQLAHGQIDVLSKALAAAKSYHKMAADNFEQGYVKHADVLSVQVRVLELEAQLQMANNQLVAAKENLNFLMGKSAGLPVSALDSLSAVALPVFSVSSTENRADLQAMAFGLEAQKKQLQMSRYRFAPRINAMGTYGFNNESFKLDKDSWMVGIKLQWRLFDGMRQVSAVRKNSSALLVAQTEYESHLNQSNMELMQLMRSIQLNYSKKDVYELSVTQAEQAMKIRSDRYQEGLERTSDLMMAESQLAETRLKYLQSVYEFNVAVFQYEWLSGQSNN